MLGVFLSAGWKLDDVLDLTWEQIEECAHSILHYQSEFYGKLLGGKDSDGKGGAPPAKPPTLSASKNPEAVLRALGGLGFDVQG